MPTNKHCTQGGVSFTGMARSYERFLLPLDSLFPLRFSDSIQRKAPCAKLSLPSLIPELFDRMFLIGIKQI